MIPVLSQIEFENKLHEINSAKIITIVMRKEPDMVKNNRLTKLANPYLGKLVRFTTINGVVNFNYENSVNKQREKEDKDKDFVAQERSWGEHHKTEELKRTPIITYNEKTYLEIKVQSSESILYMDGIKVTQEVEDDIQQYYTVKKKPNQGLDKDVNVRSIELKKIIGLKMDGNTYLIQEV